MILRHSKSTVLALFCFVAGILYSGTARATINVPAAKVSAFLIASDLGSSAPGAGGTLGLNGQMAYGGGILFGFGLGSHLEAELGYIGTIYPHGSTNAYTYTYMMEWPLMIRVPLGKVLSIGAGAYGLDTVKAGWGIGVAGSVRLSLPLSAKISLLLEGRYRYGLAPVTLPSGSQFDDVALEPMLGLTFTL